MDARRAFVTAGSALAVPPRKVSALPAYSGTTSMRPALKGGQHHLARADRGFPDHPEPLGLQRAGIDLGDHLALGEIERAHGDRVVTDRRRGLAGAPVAGRTPPGQGPSRAPRFGSARGAPYRAEVAPEAFGTLSRMEIVRGLEALPLSDEPVGGDRRVLRRGPSGTPTGVRHHGEASPRTGHPVGGGHVRPAPAGGADARHRNPGCSPPWSARRR